VLRRIRGHCQWKSQIFPRGDIEIYHPKIDDELKQSIPPK